MMPAARRLDPDRLYGRVAHYYMVRKNRSREDANRIARNVVRREMARRTCAGGGCGHMDCDHARGSGACTVTGCGCGAFSHARP